METERKINEITKLIDDYNKHNYANELLLVIRRKNYTDEITFDEILEKVCKRTGIAPERLKVKSRLTEIVRPRQMCHFIAKRNTKKSLSEIGKFFGKKDHATVLHSITTIQNLLDTDKEFYTLYSDLLLC